MMPVDTPKIAFGFRLQSDGARIAVHEQDSNDEIMDCVEVLLSTELGERQDVPDYGIPDMAFRQNGVDENALTAALSKWEDRAVTTIRTTEFANFIERLRIGVGGGSDA